jgi:hypothetical protein
MERILVRRRRARLTPNDITFSSLPGRINLPEILNRELGDQNLVLNNSPDESITITPTVQKTGQTVEISFPLWSETISTNLGMLEVSQVRIPPIFITNNLNGTVSISGGFYTGTLKAYPGFRNFFGFIYTNTVPNAVITFNDFLFPNVTTNGVASSKMERILIPTVENGGIPHDDVILQVGSQLQGTLFFLNNVLTIDYPSLDSTFGNKNWHVRLLFTRTVVTF